jgi:hypothetical protein
LAIGACAWFFAVAVAGCGTDRVTAGDAALPSSGHAYRALNDAQRLAAAATCRERAAATSRGVSARQLHAIDLAALRDQLDDAFRVIAEQHRSVADVCAEVVPFVTPALQVSFEGAKDQGNGSFTIETTSDRRLTISGRVIPAPIRGRVIARREVGRPRRHVATIGPEGRFVLPGLRLRRIADNTFTLTIEAPPNAPRKVLFSAICLDCLAGGTPPSARQ